MKIETKPVHVRIETKERLKEFCNRKGYKLGFTMDKIINEYLEKVDK